MDGEVGMIASRIPEIQTLQIARLNTTESIL